MVHLHVGTSIRIIKMKGEPHYAGRTGKITFIDDLGQLHGTWGGLAVNLDTDEIEVLNDPEPEYPRYKDYEDDFNLKE